MRNSMHDDEDKVREIPQGFASAKLYGICVPKVLYFILCDSVKEELIAKVCGIGVTMSQFMARRHHQGGENIQHPK